MRPEVTIPQVAQQRTRKIIVIRRSPEVLEKGGLPHFWRAHEATERQSDSLAGTMEQRLRRGLRGEQSGPVGTGPHEEPSILASDGAVGDLAEDGSNAWFLLSSARSQHNLPSPNPRVPAEVRGRNDREVVSEVRERHNTVRLFLL